MSLPLELTRDSVGALVAFGGLALVAVVAVCCVRSVFKDAKRDAARDMLSDLLILDPTLAELLPKTHYGLPIVSPEVIRDLAKQARARAQERRADAQLTQKLERLQDARTQKETSA